MLRGQVPQGIWPVVREDFIDRKIVAILDDSPENAVAAKIFFASVGTTIARPVRPISYATPDSVDAIVITSDRMEDRMVRRLAPLADAGVEIIRTAKVMHNAAVTPEMIESLLADPALGMWDRLSSRSEERLRSLSHADPLWVGLEITTGCNINCRMCETHAASRGPGWMDLDLFDKCLDQLDTIGCKTLTYHTIGEPTIHPSFDDVLRISNERGFDVCLSTNGVLLHRFFDSLVRWPVSTIRFSVDGATKETYERIRTGARFERLLDNIKTARSLIDEHDLPTMVKMGVALSADNIREVPLFFEVYCPYVDSADIDFGLINSLTAGEASYYSDVRLNDCQEHMVPCADLWRALYICYDGRVTACCRDYHGELIVGDVTKQSLHDIWHGKALAQLRAKHVAKDLQALPQACRNCYGGGSGRSDLIAGMIASLRRTMPTLAPEEFAQRLVDFAAKLGQTQHTSRPCPLGASGWHGQAQLARGEPSPAR